MENKYDLLKSKIKTKRDGFKEEANYHKNLNRALWAATSVLSVVVALTTNIDFELWGIPSSTFAGVFAIILPAVTGYTLLRSPEPLWIFEVDIRNRLTDLLDKIELRESENVENDYENYEKEYFEIMKEANIRWQNIKQSNSSKLGA